MKSNALEMVPRPGWDESCDLPIVGSGFAGLAAAVETKRAGSSAVAIEKMFGFSDNSPIHAEPRQLRM